MNAQTHKPMLVGLGLVSVACISCSFLLLFQAGCAGDTKAGVLGNPLRALELESLSLLPFVGGLVAGAACISLGVKASRSNRVANGAAFAVFGGFLLWLLGIQFEHWGLNSCFKP